MLPLSVSVIVVSRGRPAALQRCLAGIEQQSYWNFELVVVADPQGCAAVRDMGFINLKLIEFDEPNISAARNLGIEKASAEIVAFIDDDAVPVPDWLDHLVPPFGDDTVAAATGYVRGRNGISFQSRADWVDALDQHTPIEQTDAVLVAQGTPGKAIKTPGTNCAFRRDGLASLGGFDPVFRFYLDETDVNLRLAAIGAKTAIVRQAEVHHGYHSSAMRTAERMPTDLFEVGASQAAFLRKHGGSATLEASLAEFRAAQKARLIRHLVAGSAEPRDVPRVMKTLDAGLAEGMSRALTPLEPLPTCTGGFAQFKPRQAFDGIVTVTGRRRSRKALRAQADVALSAGNRVFLLEMSRTSLFHNVRFTNGIWEQRGGLFGKSDRDEPLFKLWRFEARAVKEIARFFREETVGIKKTT